MSHTTDKLIRLGDERYKIKTWCRSMGKINKDWIPCYTFYNSGQHVFVARGKDPRDQFMFGKHVKWRWLQPNKRIDHEDMKGFIHDLDGLELINFGNFYRPVNHVKLKLHYDMLYDIEIPILHCFYVVESFFNLSFNLQFQPLSPWMFEEGFQNPF